MLIDHVLKLDVYERFLYWIKERESIREKKAAGLPPPWTDDFILSAYRFCNVRRMDDKVSDWLFKYWYRTYFDHDNMLVACALARFINLPSSLQAITTFVFGPKYRPDLVKTVLRSLKEAGDTVFNGAYMVRGNDGQDKLDSVVDFYVQPLYDNPPRIYRGSMEKTHAGLEGAYGFGSFMAGQVVADLRWAIDGTWDDRNDWAPIGPGSARGMNRLMGRPLDKPLSQGSFLQDLQPVMMAFSTYLPDALVQKMEAHDWQNCLCEFDGYERVLHGQGRKKELYRSGAKYGY